MIRQAIVSILLAAFAVTAFVSFLPASQQAQSSTGTTQVAMNMKTDLLPRPHAHALKLQQCALDDCSDTPQ